MLYVASKRTSAQKLRHQILTSAQVINFDTLLFHGAEVNISIELGAEVHRLAPKLLPFRSYWYRTSIASYVDEVYAAFSMH